jgi:hypothetical protein
MIKKKLYRPQSPEAIKNLKLDKLWEPTPFPIEMES